MHACAVVLANTQTQLETKHLKMTITTTLDQTNRPNQYIIQISKSPLSDYSAISNLKIIKHKIYEIKD